MKADNNKTLIIALIWAASILISSLLLRTTEGKEQMIGFLIIVSGSYMALILNGTNKLSCKAENNNSKK